jgi:hypothetical protein
MAKHQICNQKSSSISKQGCKRRRNTLGIRTLVYAKVLVQRVSPLPEHDPTTVLPHKTLGDAGVPRRDTTSTTGYAGWQLVSYQQKVHIGWS